MVTALVFSLMQGIFHVYYTVALAPMIGALVAMGAALLWQRRRLSRCGPPCSRRPRDSRRCGRGCCWAEPRTGTPGCAGSCSPSGSPRQQDCSSNPGCSGWAAWRWWSAALAAALLGPLGWSLSTVATPHTGSIVTAGPRVAGAGFGPGGGLRGGPGGAPRTGQAPGAQAGAPGFGGQQPPTGGGRAAGVGGLLDAATPSADVVTALQADSSSYTWAAAAVGSQTAAGLQLASEVPVMSVGGFNGSDPSPTLAQFQQYVAQGRIHWFVSGGLGGGMGGPGGAMGGSRSATQIAAWVEASFPATTVGGMTVRIANAA